MPVCDICENLDLKLEGGREGEEQSLGSYDEILSRAKGSPWGPDPDTDGCGGCAFFCAVLQGSWSWGERQAELSGKLVFLSSLRLDVRSPERAGRRTYAADDLVLDLYADEFIEYYEQPTSTSTQSDDVEDVEEDDESEYDHIKDHRVDCKRIVPISPRDDMCFDLVQSWLAACSMHEQCAGMTPALMPKRVIEIPEDAAERPRLLVTNGELEQYVVLSHCWGRADAAGKLKDSLIPEYQQGLDLDILPQNIQDAVYITRRLGFRYLWIDALCISQDNPEEGAEEKAKLPLYYGQAALMISASTATDADSGILTARHVPMSPIMGRDRKFGLRQRILRWKNDIEYTHLATQGWAAQERMLAPRIVHYTRRQMVWECAAGLSFEASGIDDGRFGCDTDDTYYSKAKLQPLLEVGLRGLHPGVPDALERTTIKRGDNDGDSGGTELARRHYTWLQCVYEYSPRGLAVPSDKLPALAGLATILNHDGAMGEYLAGIWSKDLAAGLDWSRPWRLLSKPPAYQAPSWSWAGVNGRVSHAVLGSSHEMLQLAPPPPLVPYYDDDGNSAAVCYRWTAEFEPKLIDHHIILDDPAQPFGAVREGSYIVIEGTCLEALELPKLRDAMLEEGWARVNNPIVIMDKSNAFDCPCCRHQPAPRTSSNTNDNTGEEGRQQEPRNEAHFDICMILLGDALHRSSGYVDLLALRWVDREGRTAERAGLVSFRMQEGRDEIERFRGSLRAADKERMRLKLV